MTNEFLKQFESPLNGKIRNSQYEEHSSIAGFAGSYLLEPYEISMKNNVRNSHQQNNHLKNKNSNK